jgi:hypothetical protein
MTGINSGEVRVAGSGAMWKAPLGTTLPTDSTTAWGAAFVNLGYATDGFKVTQNLKTQGISAWQTIEQVRLIATELIRSISFESIQSNTATVGLAWGGATITPTTGGAYSMSVPGGQLTDFILGIDWNDGTTTQRLIVQHASLLALPTITYTRTDAVKYPLDVQALKPADGTNSILVYGVDAAVAGS